MYLFILFVCVCVHLFHVKSFVSTLWSHVAETVRYQFLRKTIFFLCFTRYRHSFCTHAGHVFSLHTRKRHALMLTRIFSTSRK